MGGQAAKDTIRLASKGAHFVVYGAMTKEDLLVPSSLLIFKDIRVSGFWRTGWFNSSTLEERAKILDELVRLVVDSKVIYCGLISCFDRLITSDAVSSGNPCTRLSRLRVRSAIKRRLSRCGRYSGG